MTARRDVHHPKRDNRKCGSHQGLTHMAGRPTAYKAAYAKQAEKLCLLGATDREIADFFEVDVRTIHRWKAEHDQFCHSIKAGKSTADDRVERSLYQRAVGYEQEEVKIFMPGGASEPVYAPFTAKVAPDTTAAIFWLKNRRSGDWRDKSQSEISGPDGAPISLIELKGVQPKHES